MKTTAPLIAISQPVTIVGYQVRTDGPGSADAIPTLWKAVSDGALAAIPDKLSDDLYAVYANLENAGISNDGYFSFIIGAPVAPGIAVPDGMTLVSIPFSHRASFPVPGNDPSRVIEAWEQAWAYDDRAKTFVCEYELYPAGGHASVNLGIRAPRHDDEIE